MQELVAADLHLPVVDELRVPVLELDQVRLLGLVELVVLPVVALVDVRGFLRLDAVGVTASTTVTPVAVVAAGPVCACPVLGGRPEPDALDRDHAGLEVGDVAGLVGHRGRQRPRRGRLTRTAGQADRRGGPDRTECLQVLTPVRFRGGVRVSHARQAGDETDISGDSRQPGLGRFRPDQSR